MGSFLMIVACEFITSLYASPSLSFCHMILIRWYEKNSLHICSFTCFNPSPYNSFGIYAFTVPIRSRRWVSGSNCENCEIPTVSKIVLAPNYSSSRLRVVQIGTSLSMFTSSRISRLSSFYWSRSLSLRRCGGFPFSKSGRGDQRAEARRWGRSVPEVTRSVQDDYADHSSIKDWTSFYMSPGLSLTVEVSVA